MKEKIKEWIGKNKVTLILMGGSWFLGVLMGWKAAGMRIFNG